MVSQRVGHDWATMHIFVKKKKKSFTIVILEDRIAVHLLSDTPYNLYDYLLLIFNLKEHE